MRRSLRTAQSGVVRTGGEAIIENIAEPRVGPQPFERRLDRRRRVPQRVNQGDLHDAPKCLIHMLHTTELCATFVS